MTQSNRPVATAECALGKGRAFTEIDTTEMPDAIPLDEASGIPTAFHDTFTPSFRNYEVRLAVGSPPFSAAPKAETGGWIRLAEGRVVDCLAATTLVDSWIPAIAVTLRHVRPISTVSQAIHFRRSLPLEAAKPRDFYLLRLRSHLLQDGFADQTADLWSSDGRLLVEAHHLVTSRARRRRSR
jgi:hypothetical protein